MQIISRMSSTDRWLNVTTMWPRATSSRVTSACRVGEGEDQVRLERLDGVEPRMKEARNARLLPRLRRSHRVARHPDHTIAFAEQIERFGRLLGQGRRCAGGMA
jgi:hypothetical protein